MIFAPHDLTSPAPSARPVVEWEEPDCLLCGSPHRTVVVEAPDATPGGSGLWFAVVRCRDCGLRFTSPRPSQASIEQFYPAVYRPHRLPPPRKEKRFPIRLMPDWGRPRKERQALPFHGQGRLLDFGCGGGSFLERMHRRGWQVVGVDTSAVAVQRVRTVLGLPALLGTLPHPSLAPQSLDVITMWHSLEHVHWPGEVLREAHRLLVPGGKLLVAVPNIASLPFRWFGPAWFGLDLPRHLTHFTPWTLRGMLEQAGFRVGPVRMVRHSDWLRSSAKMSERERLGPPWHKLLAYKTTSRLATWYSFLTRQSDAMILTATR